MRWELSLLALFDDLEQQAEGLRLAERDADLAELVQGEYAEVELTHRVRAAVGRPLRVRLLGGRQLGGELTRVGAGWILLGEDAQEWLVRTEAVAAVSGLPRVASSQAPSLLEQLPTRAVLRRVAATRSACLALLVDDQQLEGVVGRVGADFFELHVGEGDAAQVTVVRTAALAALLNRG